MRVLIAVHGFPPTHSAGAERRAERMAQWLVANGFQVEVFTIERLDTAGFKVETREQDGFLVHRLYYDVREGPDPFRNLYDYPPAGNALRQLLAEKSFDIVHIVSGYLLGGQVVSAACDFNVPVVITLTEYWFMCARLNLFRTNDHLCSGPDRIEKCARCMMEYKRRYRLPAQVSPRLMDRVWTILESTSIPSRMLSAVERRQEVLRTALDAVDLVICPSQYLIAKYAEYGFDTTRYQYVRQGLAIPRENKPQHQPRSDGRLRLGYIGQIKVHKGVDLLIDAVKALLDCGENVTLDLWGNEAEAPDYAQMLKKRTAAYPAIRWNGLYTGTKVWEVLAGFDALVIPSRWYENSPNAILEAYEMGVPVVATDLGGMAELVHHERSGLLFELDNALDLRAQLERLLREPLLLERLQTGIPPVKTIDDEMAEVVEYYQRLLERVR